MIGVESYLRVSSATYKFGCEEVGSVVFPRLLEDIVCNSEKFDIEDVQSRLFIDFALCASLQAFFEEIYVTSRETPGTWEY